MAQSLVSKFWITFVMLVTFGFTQATAFSESQQLCQGFIPENNLRIPVSRNATGGISEQDFNAVLDRIEQLYAEDAGKMGDQLSIVRLWQAETVNARADRNGNIQQLSMYGGLARHPKMTFEGFALVACHELGHHQGGTPKVFSIIDGSSWMTNEGGADYFATLKCLRRFFSLDDNHQILAGKKLDPFAVSRCEQQFPDRKDQEICLRTSFATESVISFFQAIQKETIKPSFETPDPTQVNKTSNKHPGTQCRMDTMFAGMSCDVPESEPVDTLDYKKGSCFSPNDELGLRPRCWFAPPI